MTSILAYYVDDQAGAHDSLKRAEVERYTERLSSIDGLTVELQLPKALNELDSDFFSNPDLFLIDYDLSLAQEDNAKPGYRGSSLATEIRSERPDCPIVLITREDVLQRIDYRTKRLLLSRLKVFDELILKSQVDRELERIQQLLISLGQGMKLLSTLDNHWDGLVDALNANDDESRLLREAAPPLHGREWIVVEATDWIRSVLIEYPGILYDDMHLATILGISVDSSATPEFRELFASAEYSGVFSESDLRWWKRRAMRVARELIERQGIKGPLNLAFREAFEETYRLELEPSRCIWDCSPGADWVCYVLGKPVKLEHTLRYYPDRRPSVMDEARVSFRAIWGIDKDIHPPKHEYDQQLVDPDAHEMIRDIENQQDPCQS